MTAVPQGCPHIGVGAHGCSPLRCTYCLCHGDLPPGIHLQPSAAPSLFLARLGCEREEQIVYWQTFLPVEVLLGCSSRQDLGLFSLCPGGCCAHGLSVCLLHVLHCFPSTDLFFSFHIAFRGDAWDFQINTNHGLGRPCKRSYSLQQMTKECI